MQFVRYEIWCESVVKRWGWEDAFVNMEDTWLRFSNL